MMSEKSGSTTSNYEATKDCGDPAMRMWGMHRRMLGYMLGHEQFTVPQLVENGSAARQAGFDLLATSDHLQPWQDNEGHSGLAWITLAALGQHANGAWMGTTVTCPTMRYNPAVVAEAFASLSLLHPGKIFAGFGSGEALNEQAATGEWPDWETRWERLIEATAIIRKLWAGDDVYHDGKHYQINAKLYDAPSQPIPILLAANGPKAMRLAGQYGDGLITDGATWKNHKDKFIEGLTAAGKTLEKTPVLLETYVVVGEKAEAEEAARIWRFGPKAFSGYHNIQNPVDIRQKAEAEIPLREVYADWVVSLDPQIHIKAINELFESGATIVNIHSGQMDQQRVIDFYGKRVVPAIKNVVIGAD
jgi:F420-dependent hydroxymycolic acid dehydrogenase